MDGIKFSSNINKELNKVIENLEKENNLLVNKNTSLQSKINQLEERILKDEEKFDRVEDQRNLIFEELNELKKKKSPTKKPLKRKKSRASLAKNKRKKLLDELEIMNNEYKILLQKYSDMEEENGNLKKKVKKYEKDMKKYEKKMKNIDRLERKLECLIDLNKEDHTSHPKKYKGELEAEMQRFMNKSRRSISRPNQSRVHSSRNSARNTTTFFDFKEKCPEKKIIKRLNDENIQLFMELKKLRKENNDNIKIIKEFKNGGKKLRSKGKRGNGNVFNSQRNVKDKMKEIPMRKAIRELEANNQRLQGKIEQGSSKKRRKKNPDINDMKKKNENLEKKIGEYEQKLFELKNLFSDISKEREMLVGNVEDLGAQLQDKSRRLESLTKDKIALENIVNDFSLKFSSLGERHA